MIFDKTTPVLSSKSFWFFYDSVSLNGGSDLLGAGRDCERRLGLKAMIESLLGNAGASGHVLVGTVCAAANQANLDVCGPAVLNRLGTDLVDRVGQVRSERTVNVWLELKLKLKKFLIKFKINSSKFYDSTHIVQVDLNYTIIFSS